MESHEPKPRLRPRISLLSLLLLMGMVATSLVAWTNSREAARLRRENAILNGRLGGLDMDDPIHGHARLVNGDEENPHFFRWQVYTPSTAPSRLVLYCGEEQTELPLPDHFCSVQFSAVGEDESWQYSLRLEDTAINFPGQRQRNVNGSASLTSPLAPPWIEPGIAEAEFECVGPWPLEDGYVGQIRSWTAVEGRVLLDSRSSASLESLGIRLSIEPLPTAPPPR